MKQINFAFLSSQSKLILDIELSGSSCTTNNTLNHSPSDLARIWKNLIYEFFPERIDLLDYKLAWSRRRQKRTLASCNLRDRKILVAQEMNNPTCYGHLPALVYHELCHAVLGYSVKSQSGSGKSRWHGKEFRELERRHPGIAKLDAWIKSGGWRHAVRSHRARNRKVIIKKKESKITRFFRRLIAK